jgi:hypothetical protein
MRMGGKEGIFQGLKPGRLDCEAGAKAKALAYLEANAGSLPGEMAMAE